MTDINAELEAIAEDVFTDDAQLDEVAADAPKKGAGAPMPAEKLPGEVQDMGPAVVSPDAKTDPGDAATDKAKQAKKPGRDGKGLPSAASPKAQGDGNGPMKSSHEEFEGDDEEESEEIVEASGDDEEEEETIEERVDRRVSAMDFSDDVQALTEGGDDEDEVSSEFKARAATIFEAAVKSKVRSELEHIEEEYAEAFDAALEEVKDELTEQVDGYLNYAMEEWMKNNEVAAEHRLKAEIAEGFINGLKNLFQEHNIAIPDEQFDMLDAAAEQVGELEGKLTESIEKNMDMAKELGELKRNEILLDVASDLADTEVEKFKSLTEDVDFTDEDTFREKLETLKESYFPKVAVDNKSHDENDDPAQDIDTTGAMSAYMSAISRNKARAS